jgi:hypothetical protein
MEKNTREKTKITLITPPDVLYNLHTNFFLLYPTDDTKSQFQNLINEFDETINVYLYERDDREPDLKWMLHVLTKSNYVILDIDNFPPQHRDIISYLIAHANVYWLTKGENEVYNILSNNRIYNLDWLYEYINGD